MFKARASLSTQGCLLSRVFESARHSTATTWVHHVNEAQCRSDFARPILDVEHIFPRDRLDRARNSAVLRKKVLREYKSTHVLPILSAYDDAAFLTSVQSYGWPYGRFQPRPAALPACLLYSRLFTGSLSFYRAWATIRVLGRWPLAVFGVGDAPSTLARCPLCEAPEVDINHLFVACRSTSGDVRSWCEKYLAATADVVAWDLLSYHLFGDRGNDVAYEEARVLLVGSLCLRVARALMQPGAQPHDISD